MGIRSTYGLSVVSLCLLVALDLVSQPRQHEVGPTWYVIRLCVTDQTGPSLGILGWLMKRTHLYVVLPWLGLGIFNKMDITQGGLLQMLRSKI